MALFLLSHSNHHFIRVTNYDVWRKLNMEEKYLIMVTTANNNKYYRMIPNGSGFNVEYGRVGASCQRRSYPMSQWHMKYNEKICKGYVDKTEERKELINHIPAKDKKGKTYKEIENAVIDQIIERLQKMATVSISANYTVSSNTVTQKMVDNAQRIINTLMMTKNLHSFNNLLLDLFTIIPRRMGNVNDFLAKSDADYNKILEREQNVLDVMAGQVTTADKMLEETKEDEKSKSKTKAKLTILEALGLEFYEISKEEEDNIKKHLGSCSGKFYRAWGVRNKRTEKAFDKFVKEHDIQETKYLWHGSRNENIWSIINKGLVFHPTNAVISGKMFGYGIYFAPKAQKSLGYTSLRGSYWASGNESSGFMAVYKVAYGEPYNVHSFDSKYYDFNWNRLQAAKKGAGCLHAHAGSMLQNDEIVVYKEEQTTVRYLVELK